VVEAALGAVKAAVSLSSTPRREAFAVSRRVRAELERRPCGEESLSAAHDSSKTSSTRHTPKKK
jgi:hypothetical protein